MAPGVTGLRVMLRRFVVGFLVIVQIENHL
jgi:hypothetical protein